MIDFGYLVIQSIINKVGLFVHFRTLLLIDSSNLAS